MGLELAACVLHAVPRNTRSDRRLSLRERSHPKNPTFLGAKGDYGPQACGVVMSYMPCLAIREAIVAFRSAKGFHPKKSSLWYGRRAISLPRSGVGTALGPLVRPVCRGDAERSLGISPTRERGSEAFALHVFPLPGEPVPRLQSQEKQPFAERKATMLSSVAAHSFAFALRKNVLSRSERRL